MFLLISRPSPYSAPRESTEAIFSPRTPGAENKPAVERGRPSFAATARSNPDVRCSALDDIAKPDLLVHNKSRQAHFVVSTLTLIHGVVAFAWLRHAIHLRA